MIRSPYQYIAPFAGFAQFEYFAAEVMNHYRNKSRKIQVIFCALPVGFEGSF
jgi:hypothetical protein